MGLFKPGIAQANGRRDVAAAAALPALALWVGLVLAATLVATRPASAGQIIAPASASADAMGVYPQHPPSRVIDQSGLSDGYVPGVTDFDAYTAANPTHTFNFTGWAGGMGVAAGDFDFDLGGSFTIESFAIWNDSTLVSQTIGLFSLLAADNPDFIGATALLSNQAPTGFSITSMPQVFEFTPTTASFVRMEILANQGGALTAFGEAIFEGSPIPEPSSFLLCTMGLAAVAGYCRRRVRAVASHRE